MEDLIQNAKAVEARLRELEYEMQEEAADTIAELCTALETVQTENKLLHERHHFDNVAYTTAKKDAASARGLLREARKIVRASSSRSIAKDWDARATAAIKAQGDTK